MAKKHGKKYREVRKMIDSGKQYDPVEAVQAIKKTAYVKFDPTVVFWPDNDAAIEPYFSELYMIGPTFVVLEWAVTISMCQVTFRDKGRIYFSFYFDFNET